LQRPSRLSARTLVLDGEVAIYDQQLRSRFEWLRELDPDAVASPSEGRIVRYAQVVAALRRERRYEPDFL
jgi:hypothetical protein